MFQPQHSAQSTAVSLGVIRYDSDWLYISYGDPGMVIRLIKSLFLIKKLIQLDKQQIVEDEPTALL